MIAFLGLLLGSVSLYAPALLWPRQLPRIVSTSKLLGAHPGQRWTYLAYLFVPFFWIVVYGLLVVPFLINLKINVDYLLFFAAPGGLAIILGLVEMMTGVSIRHGGGNIAVYVVDESIKQFGRVRIAMTLTLGLITIVFQS